MYTPNVPLSRASEELIFASARQEPADVLGRAERRFLDLLVMEEEGQVTFSPHLERDRHHVRYSGALVGELALTKANSWTQTPRAWVFYPAVSLRGLNGFYDPVYLDTRSETEAFKACAQVVRDMVSVRRRSAA